MSTRSVIAEPYGDGFRGRYHHWDGYPSALGSTIWHTFHDFYLGDVEALTARLVTNAPTGWSSINGADFSQPNTERPDSNLNPCATCGLPMWMHYRQYYGSPNRYHAGELEPPTPDAIQQFDHGHEHSSEPPHGPEGGLHGSEEWIYSDQDDQGTEWAYVISAHALFIFERRYGMPHDDQGHGTGAFGLGASNTECGGYWAPVAELDWYGVEPDWEALNQGSPLLTALT